ncbi:MAG: PBP1A family penicillin-binding protein [Candidatus Cloacimonetes bacterium]|nr:PBP1A family penicillin-binding protein [Candidatus Cloacimonadota bacterium]
MKKLMPRALAIAYIALLVCTLGVGVLSGMYRYYSDNLPPLSELEHFNLKIGSKVYDSHDQLIHTFAVEYRTLLGLREISPFLIDATISIEDNRFYDHWGIDIIGIFRALTADVINLDFSQGASTITQQLARNMFLTFDKHLARKIKEHMLAVQIERMYSKDEILELYFNKVMFGPGLYGVETASRVYFGKSATDLTLPEAALIAGVPQRPYGHDPRRFPEGSVNRRNIVLGRMFSLGKITCEQYNQAVQTPLELFTHEKIGGADDYFIEHIRVFLENAYGATTLFTGGLSIYTTLDLELTQYADSVLNSHLIAFENKNEYTTLYSDFPPDTTDIRTDYVQGGVMVMEAQTGHVKVLIGGRNFNHSKFNRITQARRQPGSSFKPILYTAALEQGYTPSTVIMDDPVIFLQQGEIFWEPHNYSLGNFGYTRLRDGLRKSRNIYAIKTIADIGPSVVVEKARRFGITAPLMPVYSLAIGTEVIKPIEMVGAYTTFPNGGERVEPIFIRRVEDSDGNVLFQPSVRRVRVTDEKIAWLMVNMMESVTRQGGTGGGIRWRGYRWAAGAKTGTTDDCRDAWFLGYNRTLVCGIWVGFDDNSSMGEDQTGATAALPPWPYIMTHAVEQRAIESGATLREDGSPIIDGATLEFHKPFGIVGVNISARTGLLPESGIDDTIYEYFIAGTEPTPLSDSLSYNFFPSRYREDHRQIVFDLGIHPKEFRIDEVYPDALILKPAR